MKFCVSVFGGVVGLAALSLTPNAAFAADYQVYKDASCSPNSICVIDYDNIPAGKTLKLTNLSCYLATSDAFGLAAAQLVLMRNKSGRRVMAITPNFFFQSLVQTGPNSKSNIFAVNDTIKISGSPGQHFRVYAQVHRGSDGSIGTVQQLSCHISGTLD